MGYPLGAHSPAVPTTMEQPMTGPMGTGSRASRLRDFLSFFSQIFEEKCYCGASRTREWGLDASSSAHNDSVFQESWDLIRRILLL